jgi:hypothetical protein
MAPSDIAFSVKLNRHTAVDNVEAATLSLLSYCRASDWAGYDPYDALNSKIFSALPVLNFRLFRLGLTQMLKRLPFNVRPLLLVPKTQNSKGLALFLRAVLSLSTHAVADEYETLRVVLTDKLIALRSKNNSYWCWGYSFPWQTRTVLVASGEPNLVCTTFVANALLDAYEQKGESRFLHMASSAAEYVLNELYWTDEGSIAGFSYPLPSSRVRVHNANFLGAALLSRVYRHSGDAKFLEPALKVARYSASMQGEDGSWSYGELPTQRWIDNFHTGYNLCALRAIGQYARTSEFETNVRSGFKFYQDNFFRDDGAPKYFHNRGYPIDIHSVAQSIITLMTLKNLDARSVPMALAVFRWAMANMRDERGYFYYRVLRFGTVKICYMRWSQAWMLLALTTLLENVDSA